MSMIDAAGPSATLGAAWRWWTGELAAMLPARLRAGDGRQTAIDIHVEPHTTAIERTIDGLGERYVEQSGIEALGNESWAQIAELSDGRPARLLLSAPDVHVSTLDLPKQARGRLRQAVALQLGEVAPVDPAELSWTVEPGEVVGERLHATLVLAKRSRVEALVAQFETRGLPRPHVGAAFDGHSVALPELPLRPLALRRAMPGWAVALALLASVPVTTLVLAHMLSWSDQRALDALSDAVSAKAAEERRWRRAEAARAALAPIAREPSLAQLLDELADRLPSTISLSSLERGSGNAMTVVLEADDPEQVRTIFEHEPRLRVSEVDEIPLDDGRMRLAYKGVLR